MPPPIGRKSSRQARKATKPGIAQGSRMKERKKPRPRICSFSSSASPSPMTSFSTSETTTSVIVFWTALLKLAPLEQVAEVVAARPTRRRRRRRGW